MPTDLHGEQNPVTNAELESGDCLFWNGIKINKYRDDVMIINLLQFRRLI
jgi:hypothetical protein